MEISRAGLADDLFGEHDLLGGEPAAQCDGAL